MISYSSDSGTKILNVPAAGAIDSQIHYGHQDERRFSAGR